MKTKIKNSSSKRFIEIDGLRGVAALLVAVFHFDIYNHLSGNIFIENSWLFVDFFFVLSGFIIAYNYAGRITEFTHFKNFILLRIGRLYPLHIFSLLLFVIVEILLFVLSLQGIQIGNEPFTQKHDPSGLILEILMAHALPIFADTSWNAPSWSISVEFFTYMVFGVVCLSVIKRLALVASIITIFGFLVILTSASGMDSSHDLALYRCLFGFFSGVLLYQVYLFLDGQEWDKRINIVWFSVLEVFALIVCVGFVSLSGVFEVEKYAPVFFAVIVFPFLFGHGIVSTLLRYRVFRLLGKLSYAIYMLHAFLFSMINVCIKFFLNGQFIRAEHYYVLLPEMEKGLFIGDAFLILTIAVLLFASHLANSFVEVPSRNRMKRWVYRK